jgi:hypothetical protein
MSTKTPSCAKSKRRDRRMPRVCQWANVMVKVAELEDEIREGRSDGAIDATSADNALATLELLRDELLEGLPR